MTTQLLFMALLSAVAGFAAALMVLMLTGINLRGILLGGSDKSPQGPEKQPLSNSQTIARALIAIALVGLVGVIFVGVLALSNYGGTGYNQLSTAIFGGVPAVVAFLLTRYILQRNRNRQISHPANQPR